MKQFLSLVGKEWFHIIRDQQTLFILFIMPIGQVLLFGYALTNEVKNARIAILDNSKDQFTTAIVHRLSASTYFEVDHYLYSFNAVESAFKKGNIKLIIVFPEKFSETLLHTNLAQIQLIADASDPNVASTLTHYASAIILNFQDQLLINKAIPYTLKTQVRMLYNPQQQGAYNFVPGIMAMILMLVCTMMTSVAIVREKELGTMEVLLVSPVKPIIIIVAKTVPYLLLSFVNVLSILGLSVWVLGVPIRGSLILLLAESILFIITCLSLGLLISSLTNSQQVAMLISLIGMFLPAVIFSGFLFPIENMPTLLKLISNLIPAKWFFAIIKEIMIKGRGISAVWQETLVLIAMSVFLLTLSLRKFSVRLEG